MDRIIPPPTCLQDHPIHARSKTTKTLYDPTKNQTTRELPLTRIEIVPLRQKTPHIFN